jgi:hypothetical protein
MYPHSFLWHFLWLAPHVLQVAIAAIMIRRGLVHEYPLFFSYTVFQIIEEGTLFALDHNDAVSDYQYWSVHWAGLAISSALRFGIIWEICSSVLRPYPALRRLNVLIFRWAFVFLLFIAIAVAARAPEDGSPHIFSRIHVLDISVNVIQSGLWLLVLGFAAYFRLSWRSFSYGIASGLGVFATVALATEARRIWTGPIAGYSFDFVTMTSYTCCTAIWLAYLLVPERSLGTPHEPPENPLEQWNAELQRLLLQ